VAPNVPEPLETLLLRLERSSRSVSRGPARSLSKLLRLSPSLRSSPCRLSSSSNLPWRMRAGREARR